MTEITEIELDSLTEDWAAVKLLPHHTGLPMAIWITENQGYPHEVRVKVSPLHGGRGLWPAAVSMAVRPVPRELAPGSLSRIDVALVALWIEFNRDVIIDFWDGKIAFDEVQPRLRRFP